MDHFKNIEDKFPNFSYLVALSDPMETDNWNGFTGFIHKVVLDNYLSSINELNIYGKGAFVLLERKNTNNDTLFYQLTPYP